MIEHSERAAPQASEENAQDDLGARVFALALFAAAALLSPPALAAGPLAKPSASPQTLVRPVAVFGADDRVPLPARMATLGRSIGLLYEPRSRAVCTAFCVGSDTIATAAHCLFGTVGTRSSSLKDVTFRLSGDRDRVAVLAGADRGTASQHVLTGSTSLSVRPPIDATRDWAFARLAAPVCQGSALPISLRSVAELARPGFERQVYQVGYHLDVPGWRLTLSPPCALRRASERIEGRTLGEDFAEASHLMLHTCDTGGASSGSPLLIDGARGPEVVGINVGTYLQSRVLTQAGEVVHRYKSDTVANTAVSASGFREQLAAFQAARIVERQADLAVMQEALALIGHYRATIDGLYGPSMRQAIMDFEQRERRPVTGIASTTLLRRLSVVLAEARAASPGPQAAQRSAAGVLLETGSVESATGARQP